MSTTVTPTDHQEQSGWIAIGSGWLAPAVFVALALALLFVPAHDPTAGITAVLITVAALIYEAGLIIAVVRMVRGLFVRAGGSRSPIVLLGGGPDPLTSTDVPPRWRIAAVLAGTIVSGVVAIAAAGLSARVDPVTTAHEVLMFGSGVSLAIAVGAFIPAPGFLGWALVLAIADARGARLDDRQRRAAQLARIIGTPAMITGAAITAALGHPMLAILGAALAFLTWTGGRNVAAREAVARFLDQHAAGDLARPLVTQISPDEPLAAILSQASVPTVVAVVDGGGVIGAIGPKQLTAASSSRPTDRGSEVMVPLEALTLFDGATPAGRLIGELTRDGFVLVRQADGLGYVEASDLGRQIRVWLALGQRATGDQHQ